MWKRLLESCPHCKHGLGVALNCYFFSQMPGVSFEFECPNCHNVLAIEVESEPKFWVEKVSRPTPYAADLAVCTFDHDKLAIDGHSTCPKCGAIPPSR